MKCPFWKEAACKHQVRTKLCEISNEWVLESANVEHVDHALIKCYPKTGVPKHVKGLFAVNPAMCNSKPNQVPTPI